jgi:glutathione S-transferase
LYTLYWDKLSGSMAPMAVLEEIGTEYKLERIDTSAGEHRSAEYRKIHPYGLVPALMLEDGRVLFESAAIVLHLCDAHPEAALAPTLEDPARPELYQWLFFMADTIYPAYHRVYHTNQYTTDSDSAPSVKAKAKEALVAQWQVLDDALANRGFLLGDNLTASDIYMFMLATWYEEPSHLYTRFANVGRVANEVAARRAVQRAMEKHRP